MDISGDHEAPTPIEAVKISGAWISEFHSELIGLVCPLWISGINGLCDGLGAPRVDEGPISGGGSLIIGMNDEGVGRWITVLPFG